MHRRSRSEQWRVYTNLYALYRDMNRRTPLDLLENWLVKWGDWLILLCLVALAVTVAVLWYNGAL